MFSVQQITNDSNPAFRPKACHPAVTRTVPRLWLPQRLAVCKTLQIPCLGGARCDWEVGSR